MPLADKQNSSSSSQTMLLELDRDTTPTRHDPRSKITVASTKKDIVVLPLDGLQPKLNLFLMFILSSEMCHLKSPSSFSMVYGRKG